MNLPIETFLKLAGFLQIALCFGSLAIPNLLNWKAELSRTSKIIAQMFWTYAGYILVINFCFGLVSLLGTEELLQKTFLSKAVCIFIFFRF